MDTKKLCLLIIAVGTLQAGAQSVLVHYDGPDGTTSNNVNDYLLPTTVSDTCLSAGAITLNSANWSSSTIDSEGPEYYGALCFGSWTSGAFVSVEVTYSSLASGGLSNFNFDIADYGGTADPDDFRVQVLKNNVLVYTSAWTSITSSTTQLDPNAVWTGTPDQNINLSSLGLNSSMGSTDTFEFRILTQGATQASGRIALDNIRLEGTVVCVPEPSSAAIFGIACTGLLLRRRR